MENNLSFFVKTALIYCRAHIVCHIYGIQKYTIKLNELFVEQQELVKYFLKVLLYFVMIMLY